MERCSRSLQPGNCRVTKRRYCTPSSLGDILGKGCPPHTQQVRCEGYCIGWKDPAVPLHAIALQESAPLACTPSTAAKHWRLCERPSAGKWRVHYVTATATELAVPPSPWECRKEAQRVGIRTPGPEFESWFCDLGICLYSLVPQFSHLWNKDDNTNTCFLGLW